MKYLLYVLRSEGFTTTKNSDILSNTDWLNIIYDIALDVGELIANTT
jgi:hypothetical protein